MKTKMGFIQPNLNKRFVIPVRSIIKDPILNKMGLGTQAAANAATSALSGVLAGALLSPFTGGASLALSAVAATNAGVTGVASAALLEERNQPEDVYFSVGTICNGICGVEWVAKSVPPGGAWQVANNVIQWSNQVFRERYVDKKSSEFQAYIEQRPPTPGDWPPSSAW